MKTNFMYPLENGEAEIILKLKKGNLKVYHGETGELLHKRPARRGDWAEIWKELSRADRTGVNVLSRLNFSGSKELSLQICTGILFAAGIAITFYFLTILMYVFS